MEENDINKRFNKYISKVKKLDNINNEDKLYLYSYFKQANFGDNTNDKPFIFNRVDMEKWKAWNSVKGTSKEESIELYIQKVKELYKTI